MFNILIIGATGVGKSTLLNSLAEENMANVGHAPQPKTLKLIDYRISEHVTLWDSPGLGETIKKDTKFKKKFREILSKKNFIDFIILVLDASSKDYETAFNLIDSLSESDKSFKEKLLLVINKADLAKYHKYWDKKNNQPTKIQNDFLKNKVLDLTRRIKEKYNFNVDEPIYCSADLDYNIDLLKVRILEEYFNTRRFR